MSSYSEYRYFLIIDLEATCSEEMKKFPRSEMETIEIGAVLVDAKSLEMVSEFGRFVRPIIHPKLTRFCRKLTTISQKDINQADQFEQVMGEMRAWLRPYRDYLFCSWGDFDCKLLADDCQRHGVTYPFQAHCNIKIEFGKALELENGCGLSRALEMTNNTFEGTPHRGIDDARNMVKLMPYVLRHQTLNRIG